MHAKTVMASGVALDVFGFDDDVYFQTLEYQASQNDLYALAVDATVGPVLDVGANIGLTAAYAASRGRSVYAFEPSRRARECLAATLESYPLAAIVPAAIGAHDGEIAFAEGAMLAGSHVVVSGAGHYSAPMRSLDSWVDEVGVRPGLIKIDVEGFEQSVLDGARATLARGALVVMEVNPFCLDVVGGHCVSRFLSDLIETVGPFLWVRGKRVILARDRDGAVAYLHELLIGPGAQWGDVAFCSDLARLAAFAETLALAHAKTSP